jgi:hypothetical protein
MNLRSLESSAAEFEEPVELLDIALPEEVSVAPEVVPAAVLPLPVVAEGRVVSVALGAAGVRVVVVPPDVVPDVWAVAVNARPHESKATASADFLGIEFDMIDSFDRLKKLAGRGALPRHIQICRAKQLTGLGAR